MSPGLALFLLVLFVLVALAGASFFRHTLAVLVVFQVIRRAGEYAIARPARRRHPRHTPGRQ